MFGFLPLCLLILVQNILTKIILSAPYLATPSLTRNRIKILRHVSSPITILPLNITAPVEDTGIPYHVPQSLTTLYFYLDFPCKEAGLRSTILSARVYCEEQLEQGGDGPLPRKQDLFHEDLGYGAAINVVSARPDRRLTWGILKDAMDGLWEFLVVEGRYVECEFDICYGSLDLVGRGRIRDAPETSLARQSRRRTVNDSLGFMCT